MTVGMTAKVIWDLEQLRKGKDVGTFKSLEHAAAKIRKIAIDQIEKYPRGIASTPGHPIHTHRHDVPRCILYALDNSKKKYAIIGTDFNTIGLVGEPHEHGGMFRGRMYPERPFMAPALEKVRPELSKFFANSIK
jgi:hypothetical protein